VIPDPSAAEIEAVIEKDKRQQRRKVSIACLCMGVLGVAAVIGAILCLNILSDSGLTIFSDLSTLRIGVVVVIAGSWPFLHSRIDSRYRVIRATVVALTHTLLLAILWLEWDPVLFGVSFLVLFLVSVWVDALGSRSSKSEQC